MRCTSLLFLLALGIGLAAGCRDTARPPAQAAQDTAASPASPAPAPAAPAPARSAARGDTIPLSVVGIVAGTSYQTEGKGACETAADASIYGTAASLWRTSFTEPGDVALRHISLTVWLPKNGGAAQLTLSLRAADQTYQIATVKGGKIEGQGSATVERQGDGATLTVEGTAGDGTAVRVSVACTRVGAVVAEGG